AASCTFQPTPQESDANSEKLRISEALTEVAHEMFCNEHRTAIPMLLENIDKIDFESAKFVEHLFTLLMSKRIEDKYPAVDYITRNMSVLYMLVDGYQNPEHAVSFGGMLREACSIRYNSTNIEYNSTVSVCEPGVAANSPHRHEKIAEIFLHDARFYSLFSHVHGTAFDISSDGFTTLRDLLTRHKPMVARFLEKNFDQFFENYRGLVESDNYVTRRQALKLLGEILLDRHNYGIMTRYIASAEHLKLIMNALKSRQKQIAFEAFHCFKVFVANPNKPRSVQNILVQNQDKLVDFLQNFQTDRQHDSQFNDEKQYLMKEIRDMRPLPPPPTAAVSGSS
uniref:Calcium-binding protein n=1 Tax=Macrostomum lignano TaxID=282301 RepID=A0A1I8G6G4_9PLAT